MRTAMHFVAQDSLMKTKAEYLMKAGLTCMNQEGEYRLYGLNYLILLNVVSQDEYAPKRYYNWHYFLIMFLEIQSVQWNFCVL